MRTSWQGSRAAESMSTRGKATPEWQGMVAACGCQAVVDVGAEVFAGWESEYGYCDGAGARAALPRGREIAMHIGQNTREKATTPQSTATHSL